MYRTQVFVGMQYNLYNRMNITPLILDHNPFNIRFNISTGKAITTKVWSNLRGS